MSDNEPKLTSFESNEKPDLNEEEKQAKAAQAREERAKARALKKESETNKEEEKLPSPNQPKLDHLVTLIKQHISEEAIENAYINELDRHLPYVIINKNYWVETSIFLKEHKELDLNYLRNVSGVDLEDSMEVVYHLFSFSTKNDYCIKVKTEREHPSIPSVTPVWNTANWNEREIFDLLGIDFPGHPNLCRIMMSDDWVGHPLRKDYVSYDPEV